jgi:hypothetical protein
MEALHAFDAGFLQLAGPHHTADVVILNSRVRRGIPGIAFVAINIWDDGQ